MAANDRPVVTRKGFEQGNTTQSGGLKLMTGVARNTRRQPESGSTRPLTRPGSAHCRTIMARPKPAPICFPVAPATHFSRATGGCEAGVGVQNPD